MTDKEQPSPNIYQRLNAVRKEVKYIKKDQEVQGYMAVTHDNVTAMTRDSLIDNGVMIIPSMMPGQCIDKKYQSGKDYIQMRSMVEVTFINADDPQDQFTVTVEAHADDSGDKAPGKVLSYAVKYAILKVLYLETGESDESRNLDYTPQQKQSYDSVVEANDALGMRLLRLHLDEDTFIALFNSFPKGEKTKMKAKIHDMENAGTQILLSVEECLQSGDYTLASESVEGLSVVGKAMMRRHLGREGMENLNELLRQAGAEEI